MGHLQSLNGYSIYCIAFYPETDQYCGSGGMFDQPARFVKEHQGDIGIFCFWSRE